LLHFYIYKTNSWTQRPTVKWLMQNSKPPFQVLLGAKNKKRHVSFTEIVKTLWLLASKKTIPTERQLIVGEL
jgi:hypothetical protein